MFNAAEFGARLREKRNSRGLTQTNIYDLTGVAEVTVNRIERAKTSTTLSTLALVADAMGCDLVIEFIDRPKKVEGKNESSLRYSISQKRQAI